MDFNSKTDKYVNQQTTNRIEAEWRKIKMLFKNSNTSQIDVVSDYQKSWNLIIKY